MTPFLNFEMLRLVTKENAVQPLEHDDVTRLIFKALSAAGVTDRLLSLNLADKVIYRLKNWKGTHSPISVNELEHMIKFALTESGNATACTFVGNDGVNVN